MHDDTCRKDCTCVDTVRESSDGRVSVSGDRLLLFSDWEAQLAFNSSRNVSGQITIDLSLRGSATLDQVAGLDHEVANSTSLRLSIEVRVNGVGGVIVSDSLTIAFEVLENSGSVEEQIWVGLGHLFLSLSICFQSKFELFCILSVHKEVCKMRVAKNIYKGND